MSEIESTNRLKFAPPQGSLVLVTSGNHVSENDILFGNRVMDWNGKFFEKEVVCFSRHILNSNNIHYVSLHFRPKNCLGILRQALYII